MSEKIFSFLLHLYPPGFRERYYQEAVLLYRDRRRHETGFYRRARLWCDLLSDFVIGLPTTWLSSCPAVAVHSESINANGSPSFRLLQPEPLRPAVVLVAGILTLGAAGAFTFVLNVALLQPLPSHTKLPIELVMDRLNQPALPEAGNRAQLIESAAGSMARSAEQSRTHGGSIAARVDVAHYRANNAISETRAQNLPNARRFRNSEQRTLMVVTPLGNDGRVLPESNQPSAGHPVRNGVGSHGWNISMVGDQNNSSTYHGQARPEGNTRAALQHKSDGLDRPPAGGAYVNVPLDVRLLLSEDCTTIRASRELPDQIKNAFATITHESSFALADPGARLHASDLIEPRLSGRRLVLAGRCHNGWFIEYEHSGTAKSVALMVLRPNPDKSVTFVWGRQLRHSARDLAQLRAVLANASYLDEPYSW
jgi:hypothetical protein